MSIQLNRSGFDFSGFSVPEQDPLDTMSAPNARGARSKSAPPQPQQQLAQPQPPPPAESEGEEAGSEGEEEDEGPSEEELKKQKKTLVRKIWGYKTQLWHLVQGVTWPGGDKPTFKDINSLELDALQDLFEECQTVAAISNNNSFIHGHNAMHWTVEMAAPIASNKLGLDPTIAPMYGLFESAYIEPPQKTMKDIMKDCLIEMQITSDYGAMGPGWRYAFATMGNIATIVRKNQQAIAMNQNPSPVVVGARPVSKGALNEFSDLI